MEELSAEKFRKFTDVLFDVLGKNDVDVNRLIEAKEAVLRNTEEYRGRSEKELRAIAYSEVVAEMMETAMTDTDAISRISQKIKQQDRSLWGKIKDFIKGIVEKLKAAYRDMEPDSAIARLTRETVTSSEAVLEAFSDAAADAVMNYNLQETAKENGLRYSDYTFTNRDGESVDYLKSARITDKETLDFLNDQETVTTYKTMQLVDGKLYPPMAAVIQGSYEDASELGKWEMAVEHPELIKIVNGKPKFTLNKGKGKGSLAAAYNPYMHSSNLVLNDQFSGAYLRPNLVTVECKVPVSELTSGYKAQYAKDSVGWHSWHTGTVAGALRQQTGVERQVLLSRYIMPVRILSNAEVAGMYAELLNGTGIAVPDNVVPPALLAELKKAGVTIRESGKVQEEGQKNNAREGVQFMSRNSNDSEIVSIKQQIAEAKDELTQMQSVANVAVQDLSKMTQKQRYDWAVNELKRTGYKVDRPDFGVIEFTPKQINTGMNYLRSAEDVAAFAVLPKVLKQGNIIFENKNHKGRQFATFTISAPVTINGTTGYMAVVVQETSSRHYHTHRIVLPDGSAFKFEMQHSDPSGGFAQNSTRLATNTNAASKDSVAQPNAEVKGNFLKSSRDSAGNALTEAQQRYFADSQVRDEDGKLIPVYHSTGNEFYIFDRNRLGETTLGNATDASLAATALVGHWFSDHDLGNALGDRTIQSYLNIENPYTTDLDTLAAEIGRYSEDAGQMQADFEDGDYRATRQAANAFVDWLRENGYDGLVVADTEFGGNSYVVLDSEQAKLTTNQNPTGARDLRYSSRTASDSEYLNLAQNPEKNREALSRMVENAAREAGYTEVVYHGTNADFTVFDKKTIGKNFGAVSDLGFYFTPYYEDARGYSTDWGKQGARVMKGVLKFQNPLVIEDTGWGSAIEQTDNRHGDLLRWAQEGKHDGIIVRSMDEEFLDDNGNHDTVYIAFDSNQFKSLDPVTYDDNGNVIPLSQRFNMGKDDIRYSARNPQTQVEAENERLKSDVKRQIAEAVREYRRQQDVQSKAYKQMYERQLEEVKKSYQKQISTMEAEYSANLAQIQDAFIQTVEAYEKGQFRNEHLEKVLKQAAETQRAQAKASEADNATWEKEFKRLLKAYETSGRNVERLKQTVEAQRARAKAKVEAARVTEQRGKLYRAVNEINRRLLNPTKTLYVPDSLAPAVTKFMQGLTEAMESPKNSWNVQGALETLQGQYQKLTQMNEGVFTQEYNQGILDLLDNAINAVGGTDFNKLSAGQIEDVYSAVRSVLTAIRNENKMFAANLNKTYAEAAAAVLREESALPNRKPTTGAVQDKAEKFGWNQLKPVYAMMRLGSDTLLKQYNNLRAGEDKWQRVIAAARAYGLGIMAKYHYDQWNDNLMKLDTETGTVELSLEERMSLYAYARREQAFEHLTKGGFVLSDKNTRTVKNRLGIETEQT